MPYTQRVVYYSYDIVMDTGNGDRHIGCRVWEAVNPKSPVEVLEDIENFVSIRFLNCKVANFRRID